MSNVAPINPAPVEPQQTPASGPPAGWYDANDGSGRQRWFDGTVWTDHFQSAPSAPQQPIQVTVAAPV
jgi:hypothetical protein